MGSMDVDDLAFPRLDSNRVKKTEDEDHENYGRSCLTYLCKGVQSPSSVKWGFKSEGASPSNRAVCFSQNENEVVWDLTSPSARKYQVLLSDKKTSTPVGTPSRSRLVGRRPALCKKNIALSSSISGNSADLFSELAALNDLVNSEQAQSSDSTLTVGVANHQMINESGNETRGGNNSSDLFTDNSMFDDSLLLSTQALEVEALTNKIPKAESELETKNRSSSLCANISRKSFDLDNDLEEFNSVNMSNTSSDQLGRFKGAHEMKVDELKVNNSSTSTSIIPIRNCNELLTGKISYPSAVKDSLATAKSKIAAIDVPKTVSVQNTAVRSAQTTLFTNDNTRKLIPMPQQQQPVSFTAANSMHQKPLERTASPVFVKPSNSSYSKHKTPIQEPVVPRKEAHSNDLFDDDEDDLLCAVAEEVESKYISSNSQKKEEMEDDDDIFQPDVLEFISQIEMQAISSKQSTVNLVEQKRQAAILKRQQRMLNKR